MRNNRVCPPIANRILVVFVQFSKQLSPITISNCCCLSRMHLSPDFGLPVRAIEADGPDPTSLWTGGEKRAGEPSQLLENELSA
jgi:hypothetical protein